MVVDSTVVLVERFQCSRGKRHQGQQSGECPVKGEAATEGCRGCSVRAEAEKVNAACKGLWEGACWQDTPGRNCYRKLGSRGNEADWWSDLITQGSIMVRS